jgi:maltooligosyltrehalose trehalohydrolase
MVPRAPATAGATVDAAGVSYRVWGPALETLTLVSTRARRELRLPMRRDAEGFWTAVDPEGRAGDLYVFELPDGAKRPDPRSRFQPRGVDGPSEVIDPSAFEWKTRWQRPGWRGQSLYELHVGTFTEAGTFAGARAKLEHLEALGVEALELMPLADFPGERGWGYDGVALYAPARCYGRPDELRALVDAAHARGLAVILDVVYNHLGPVGNHLAAYATDYFGDDTLWGRGFKLQGPRAQEVRRFVRENACSWLDEYRFDGLRLDATHAIVDPSPVHLLEELALAVHERGGFVIVEDDRNEVRLLEPRSAGGLGFDAAWSDDFHHQVHVALTGEQQGYYANYSGSTAALADVLQHGWTYRGQLYPTWKKRRGTDPHALPASAFVLCTENHDQVGNRELGERLDQLVSPAKARAASVLLCLSPYPPMIFMGQEWAASAPFLYFTDHDAELGQKIIEGRAREFGHQGSPNPQAPATFERSKLDWRERHGVHGARLALFRDALRLRGVLKAGPFERARWKIEALGEVLALRLDQGAKQWLLLVALHGAGRPVERALLQPPTGQRWATVLDSEAATYGGAGAAAEPFSFPGPRAVLCCAEKDPSNAPA